MRLLRLDLEKYGAFEGRSLAFRADARLHVVFGPNEAGKSSALAAVSDLLFGFGARTDFAFRHATTELRLGALIADREGREQFFRRRKGNKATLIDADDQPLRDDLLAPFLGALGRETFERAFGLNAKALREGGEELRQADGEAGASLFAAASGLRGLEERRRAIEEEADALFRPQASTKRFNAELRDYDAARKEVSGLELGQAEWKRVNDAIERLGERHGELGDRLKALRTDRARVERLGRAFRAATAVDEARRALEAVGDGPSLSPTAAETLARALDAADAAGEALSRAAETIRAGEADVADVALDASVLAAGDAIEAALRESGAYRTLQTDLPRVQREADEREARLAALAARLGLADAAAVERARPTDAVRAELGALVEEGREQARAATVRDAAIAAERERLAALEAARGGAEPVDPRPVREGLAALAPRLRSLDRRGERAAEAAAETRALAEAAARLSPPVRDLDALAARPLPGAETIAAFRAEAEKRAGEAARIGETLARDRAELARTDKELRALASGAPIASPEAIREARAARSARWEPLRGHLLGAAPRDPAGLAADAASFERSVEEADRLADRAAEDAGRAAQEAALKRRRAELDETVAADEARAEAARSEAAAALERWRAAWAPAAVEPAGPLDMEAWRREIGTLLERRERNARRLAEVAALDLVEAEVAPELRALASLAGLAGADGLGGQALGARLEARLATLADLWQQAGEAAATVAELKRRITGLEAQRQAGDAVAAAVRARLAIACPQAGLSPDAPLVAVAAALAAWDEAPALIDERDYRLKRIRGMGRDASTYVAEVGALVAATASDLADLPPDAAVRRLNERLTAARAASARHAEAARRLGEARGAETRARARLDEVRETLAEASAEIGEGEDLRALLGLVATRERLAATLAERVSQLALVGERAEEETLRGELLEFDPDSAPAAIEALKAEETRLEAEDRQVYAELAAARERREALGGSGAEEAAARQRAAGAALAATAREWAVLKVAGLMIGAAMDRARAADRNPTLDRAGALFRTLTGGAYDGFSQDFDRDEPTLVALRASGERVAVSGLSEGTRDQFYLALRLAALEDYAGRAEPAPFVGDDLFASFDDARTAHGLTALAEIGAKVQPILFTHHRSVAETAVRTLGAQVDLIEIDALGR